MRLRMVLVFQPLRMSCLTTRCPEVRSKTAEGEATREAAVLSRTTGGNGSHVAARLEFRTRFRPHRWRLFRVYIGAAGERTPLGLASGLHRPTM
jgi:hypothetical protein